jgi:hypothetical protein
LAAEEFAKMRKKWKEMGRRQEIGYLPFWEEGKSFGSTAPTTPLLTIIFVWSLEIAFFE